MEYELFLVIDFLLGDSDRASFSLGLGIQSPRFSLSEVPIFLAGTFYHAIDNYVLMAIAFSSMPAICSPNPGLPPGSSGFPMPW
jgi:hypothetical protein